MHLTVLTLFPEMFDGVVGNSILKRAREGGFFDIRFRNFREHGLGVHKKVDDSPYGGGPGMVLQCQPVFECLRASIAESEQEGRPRPRLVMLTPQGRPFNQNVARELAKDDAMILLCGHYEGFDERIRQGFEWDEISIGDFVLTGGEIAAMVLMDAVVRLLPGVLGDDTSSHEESFEEGLLEYPQYTRPPEFEGMKIPEILLSGHHAKVAEWRREQAKERTRQRRPDLWQIFEETEALQKKQLDELKQKLKREKKQKK